MPRSCKCRMILEMPRVSYYKPAGIPMSGLEETVLSIDGLEAMRLADEEGLGMEEAATHMGVSRHTFGRILAKAHQAVAHALIHGQALRVEGGNCAVSSPLTEKDENHE